LGENYAFEDYLEAVKKIIRSGVHNINHVTPDHFWPYIKELILRLREEKIRIPQLANSSGYQAEDILRDMTDLIDIFLPDFKFADPDLAALCIGRRDYPETALKAIAVMVNAKGFLEADFSGSEKRFQPASQGVMVRHLVLPGHADNSIRALEMLHAQFGPFLPLSIMSQYMPTVHCQGKKEFARGVSKEEYGLVLEAAERLGFENMFCQELTQNAAFFPDFSNTEPFDGNKDNVRYMK
jgi:putative pyruvate formate lyase activating enzyme